MAKLAERIYSNRGQSGLGAGADHGVLYTRGVRRDRERVGSIAGTALGGVAASDCYYGAVVDVGMPRVAVEPEVASGKWKKE